MSDEPPKKTGLGNLLLQRTIPRSKPTRPQPAAALSTPPSSEPTPVDPSATARRANQPPTVTSQPPRSQTKKHRTQLRIRRTLHLEMDLDEQLSAVAGIERRERSEIVNELLRRHLRKYEVIIKK